MRINVSQRGYEIFTSLYTDQIESDVDILVNSLNEFMYSAEWLMGGLLYRILLEFK